MEVQLVSLAIIMLVAALAPLVAGAIPGKPVPEVVFLVFAGAFLGPHMAGFIATDGQAITMVSDLGLGFLFLMAGYEIDPRSLMSKTGAFASVSWVVSIAIALAIAWFVLPGEGFGGIGGLAFAIALTTTAYGTLAPIMRERGLVGTRVGDAVTAYGATGEVFPVLAMAFLLSSRSPIATALILAGFVVVCVILAAVPRAAKHFGSRAWRFLMDNAGKGSRPLVRMTVLILVFLLALSEAFDLDLVLGAFAAGFILRSIFPEGNEELEESIESVSNGFLTPAFFVISGANIDLAAAASAPGLVVSFIGLLILVRGVVVAISLRMNPDTRDFTWRETFSCAAYCTMALPLIVAVTSVATSNGAMSDEIASILVTSGAITVLLVPIVTSLVRVTAEAHPVQAVQEVRQGRATLKQAWEAHRRALHEASAHYHEVGRLMREQGTHFSSADYLASVDSRTGASLRATTPAEKEEATKRNAALAADAKVDRGDGGRCTSSKRAAHEAAETAARTQERMRPSEKRSGGDKSDKG